MVINPYQGKNETNTEPLFVQLKKWEDKINMKIDWYQAFFNTYMTQN